MSAFAQIMNVELIAPTSIRLQLISAEDALVSERIVMSPNDFITDFGTFLTAVRASGEKHPVDIAALTCSWKQRRKLLRKILIDEDPWGEHPQPTKSEPTPDYWAMELCLGSERAEQLFQQILCEAEQK
ncbi:MAG: hypothetical protein ABSA16_00890 [Thermoguttaceae bacterium]|jgi:hypothetical protein